MLNDSSSLTLDQNWKTRFSMLNPVLLFDKPETPDLMKMPDVYIVYINKLSIYQIHIPHFSKFSMLNPNS